MNKHEFTEAFSPHYADALRYCHALTAKTHHTEAEDLLQDSLLTALSKWHQLKDNQKFRPWFFRIIYRTFVSQTRKKLWRRFLPLQHSIIHLPKVYDGHEINEDHADILNALAKLSSKHRAALLLYELAGFSIEEIRTIQGDRSISAVKSRLSRSRKKLQALMHDDAQQQTQFLKKDYLENEIQQATKQAIEKLEG